MYKMRLKASALAMSYISNEEKVRDMVRSLDIHLRRQPHPRAPEGIKVSAVRFEPKRYKNLGDYISQMNGYVAPCAASGSAIVAFPELVGMTVMSMMPTFSALYGDFLSLGKAPLEQRQAAFFTVCETVQGFVGEIFLNTFSQLARSHRIIIAAGGIYQIEDGKLYNRQFLFSENGDVAGVQNKLFLSPLERELGVTSGDRLTPGATDMGKIALLGGGSLPHYEPYWIAAATGCRYAVAGASPYVATDCKLARYRAQEQGICVIVPAFSGGKDYDMSLSSPAGIYSPRAATEDESGICAEEQTESLITAKIDLNRCAEHFDMYSADKNIRFFRALIKESSEK